VSVGLGAAQFGGAQPERYAAEVGDVSPTSDHEWVALDFETATGRRASACAVGLVYVRDGRIAGVESFLIQPPGNAYSRFNISIHGIDPSMTRDSPTFGELWTTLADRIDGRPVAAHNASFDMSVLRYELDHLGLRYPDLEYYCTLVLARACWPGLHGHRLPDVASHCGIAFQHHDAAEDARACAEILLCISGASGHATPRDVAARHGVRPGRLYAHGYCTCSRRY
jgi:DNA polymerase-3 subunit epsilon